MIAGIRAAGVRAAGKTRGWPLLAGLLLLLPVGAAQAAPVTYFFTGGYATISATFGASTIGAATIPLTGTQAVFDTAPAGLVTFDFDSTGPHVIPLTGILTGTSITLSNLQVAPGVPYTNFSVTGGPTTYNFVVGGVDVTGTAALSGLINSGPSPVGFTNPTLAGQIQLGTGTLALNGITIGVVPVPAFPPFFAGGNVTVKADIVFTGIVPEPGTAVLLGAGLAGMGAAGRRSRRS